MKQYDVVKRGIDVLVGGLALIISAPVQAAIAVLIRRELGSPVLFRQPRPGKDGEVFELAKFRTMHAPDPDRGLVTDEQRMTRLGSLLRSTSLDELPTLWSVVKGDMSLVGPRPVQAGELALHYGAAAEHYLAVRPGITGWAQINGWRGETDTEEKIQRRVEHDLFYIENWSLWLDLKILVLTALRELRSRDAF